jgi:hypothetical protein
MTDSITPSALVALLTATFTILVSALVYTMSRVKRRLYDDQRNRVILEDMRASFESKLYDINKRLLATEDRWKDVNHLLISSQRLQRSDSASWQRVQLNEFLRSLGLAEADLVIDKKLVFVLTPFHAEHQRTFEVIAASCKDAGLNCLRGDEEFSSGDILSHIVTLMVKANIVIANIDGRNANVAYELGIAHAIGKPVIIVSRTLQQLPFDVQSKRIIVYSDTDDLRVTLKNELIRALTRG